MAEFSIFEASVVFSVSAEIFCEDNLAEFQPVIRLQGSFLKEFGERFMDKFSSRFTDFIFMIADEISSCSQSSDQEVSE